MKNPWIWCLCNTILISVVALGFKINSACESAQDQSLRDLYIQVQTLESCVNQKDTIIVNINNNVKVPSRFNVAVEYPADYEYYLEQ